MVLGSVSVLVSCFDSGVVMCGGRVKVARGVIGDFDKYAIRFCDLVSSKKFYKVVLLLPLCHVLFYCYITMLLCCPMGLYHIQQ